MSGLAVLHHPFYQGAVSALCAEIVLQRRIDAAAARAARLEKIFVRRASVEPE